MTSKHKTTAIDLFAGAGGFSLSAQNLGIQVLAAVEYDQKACETYKLNLIDRKGSDERLYNENILELDPKTILNDLRLESEEVDLLIGGPPCQGFSQHRIKDAGVDDPRNKLLNRYFDYLAAIRPKVFVVENVQGLLWARHKDHLDKFYESAKKSGYKVKEAVVLNAKDYGVPQNRKRVFILGIRNDIKIDPVWPPIQSHFSPKAKEVIKDGKPAWNVARPIFEKKIKKSDRNNIHMNPSPAMVERFKDTPPDGGSRTDCSFTLPCHGKGYSGHKDVYGRMRFDTPANTITTGCTNPSKGRFVHPTEHHGITARHCARFQTFPDWYEFIGGLGVTGRQIGNAVPIRLGEAVLTPIKEAIENCYDN